MPKGKFKAVWQGAVLLLVKSIVAFLALFLCFKPRTAVVNETVFILSGNLSNLPPPAHMMDRIPKPPLSEQLRDVSVSPKFYSDVIGIYSDSVLRGTLDVRIAKTLSIVVFPNRRQIGTQRVSSLAMNTSGEQTALTVPMNKSKRLILAASDRLWIHAPRETHLDRADFTTDQFFIDSTRLINTNVDVNARCIRISNSILRGGGVKSRTRSDEVAVYRATLDSTDISIPTSSFGIDDVTVTSYTTVQIPKICTVSNLTGDGTLALHLNDSARDAKRRLKDDNVNNRKFPKHYDFLKSTVVLRDTTSLYRIAINPDDIVFAVDTQLPYRVKKRIYEQLIERFGDQLAAERYYTIAYKRMVNERNDAWLLDYFQDNWTDYGYKPEQLWIAILQMLLVLFCINLIFYPYYLPSQKRRQSTEIIQEESVGQPLWRRFFLDVYHTGLYTVRPGFIGKPSFSDSKISDFFGILWTLINYAAWAFILVIGGKAITRFVDTLM